MRGTRFTRLLLVLGLLPANALADGADPPREPAAASAACEAESLWSSRHHGRTPTRRLDCVHPLAGSRDELRVSHQQRAIASPPEEREQPWTRLGQLTFATPDESQSSFELAGSRSTWSYALEFELERETHFEAGRLLPEDRSRLHFQTGLDFGIVRPRLELQGSHAKQLHPVDEIVPGIDFDRGDSTQSGARAFVDVALPNLPVLTLGAGRDREAFHGSAAQRGHVESDVLSAALWYERPGWQAYAVSSLYSLRGDQLGEDSVLYDHFASGSFWPSETLTISPSLQYSLASYDGRVSWMETLSASLGIYSVGVWDAGLLTLWTGYDQSRDTAKTFEYRQLHFALGAERTVPGFGWLAGYQVSFGGTLGYSHYMDLLDPAASGPGFRTLFTLRISAL